MDYQIAGGIILLVILIVSWTQRKWLYNYYTIEIWSDNNSSLEPFIEDNHGPNLRQNKLTGKWEVGRENFSFFGKATYVWQPIEQCLADEILEKMEEGDVQILFRHDGKTIVAV